jgi:dihydrofolate synthase / folylpolyglutamate synthase
MDTKKYNDTIAFLYALQKHGIKLGLENTTRLMSFLGNPHEKFRSVHIAGTNGKGSTSAMIASMLQAAHFRVGLFTSPHLVSFTERIRVNGIEIEESDVVAYTDRIRGVVSDHFSHSPTFFEYVTAMAFLYFEREGVELAVVETGMGGRLDATTVITPSLSVITRIGYDHQEFLGHTLREIAMEKAGIIKEGIPVVSSAQAMDAMEVIEERASEMHSRLYVYGKEFRASPVRSDLYGNTFDYEGERILSCLFVPLCGMHQIENASLAVKAFELLMGEDAPHEVITKGLFSTAWPGRLELRQISQDCDLLIDGAHNPPASIALSEALEVYYKPFYRRIILILGIMADKDIEGIMKPLLSLATEVILTAPDYQRAAAPETLLRYASSLGFKDARTAERVSRALEIAKDLCLASPAGDLPQKSLIVVTGSFYTIGEAGMALGQKGVLPRLRE